jgi:hypothetical protein
MRKEVYGSRRNTSARPLMFSRRSSSSLPDAGSCAEHIASVRFVDDITFETKLGDFGMLLSFSRIDRDCRRDEVPDAFNRLCESIAVRVPSDLSRFVANTHQFEVLYALEVNSVPREQRQTMGQSNAGDQTVAHSYCLAGPVKLAANICRVPRCSTVERQRTDGIKQLADGLPPLIFASTAQKLKTAHSCGLELVGMNVFRNLILHRLDAAKEIDQNIRIGENHRQLSRRSLAVRRNSSPSFFESEPPSDSRTLRRFSRSTSSCRKLSMASPSTAENPFCPRRDASASRALRCSGFISTVVRIISLYMHMHVLIDPTSVVAGMWRDSFQYWLTRHDPELDVIVPKALGQRNVYDPGKTTNNKKGGLWR